MEQYTTKVTICGRVDRETKTIYVDESAKAIKERYVKAALGDRQLTLGEQSIDLNENIVLSIEQVFSLATKEISTEKPGGSILKRLLKQKREANNDN